MLAAAPPKDKLRFRFDFRIESVGFERDALDSALSVVVSRGGKVARTAPVPTVTQVPSLDHYTGNGRHVYKDGSKYTGGYLDGKRHGRGVLRFKNGGYYEGQWADDGYEGTGRYVSTTGVYEGMFRKGELCGRGVFRWANGDTYDGEWAGNAADGVGTKTYADGRVEEGRWKGDQFLGCPEVEENCETFTGFGRKRWADGSAYVGEWLSGKRHGQGIFTFASGDIYEGAWAMDKFEGHGKYTSAEGTYEGGHRAGSWCGKGEFQWLDGRVYRGEFRDSAFNGHGKITYPDGTVRKGKWEEDDFVGSDSDDDDDDVSANEQDSNAWPFSKGQAVADRGVAEGPQIVELEFKEAASPGLVLVQKVNVVTGKIVVCLDEILPGSAADKRTDLRCGMLLTNMLGQSVADASLKQINDLMTRRPLTLTFVDGEDFFGGDFLGKNQAISRRSSIVPIHETVSLLSTLRYNKKGRPELGYRNKSVKIDVCTMTGKGGKKKRKIGNATLNLADIAVMADPVAPVLPTSERRMIHCKTKLKHVNIVASIVATWIAPGSAMDDVSDGESDVSNMSSFASESSGVSDVGNIADFSDEEHQSGAEDEPVYTGSGTARTPGTLPRTSSTQSGGGSAKERRLSLGAQEAERRRDKPLHMYSTQDVAIALRELNLGKYEAYFRERRIDGNALSTLSRDGWKDLFENVLGVPVPAVDQQMIEAKFAGNAVKNAKRSIPTADAPPPSPAPDHPPESKGLNMFRRGAKNVLLANRMVSNDLTEPEPETEPETETVVETLEAELARCQFDSCTIHVGGLGGEFEDEGAIGEVFSRFGRFIQATVRQRPGINKSWALVTLSDRAACERAISETVKAGDSTLVVKSVSMEQAMASTGSFGQIWRVAKTRSSEKITQMLKEHAENEEKDLERSRRESSPSSQVGSLNSRESASPEPDALTSRTSLRLSRSSRLSNASNLRRSSGGLQSFAPLLSVEEAFDIYDENKNGVADMDELRAIFKALGHHPTDEDLLQVLNGDPEAEVGLDVVKEAMHKLGYGRESPKIGSPGWQRSRTDSHKEANKFSGVGGGSKLDVFRQRTKAVMLVNRLGMDGGRASPGSDSKDVRASRLSRASDQASYLGPSRLEEQYAGMGGSEESREALALAADELSSLQTILDSLDASRTADTNESTAAAAQASSQQALKRLLSGKMNRDLQKNETVSRPRASPDPVSGELLGRAVQDLCEVKVLLSEADGDKDNLVAQKHVLEARNYELELEKSNLYATVIETKLNLAQAELERQKLTVSLKRERQHRDLLGQRIAALELRLAAETANRNAGPTGADGADLSAEKRMGGPRQRRKAEVGLQMDDDDEEFQPPVVPKNAKSREFIRQAVRHEDLFAHLQPEQCKMIVAAMSRAEYSEGDTIIKKDDITSYFYVLEAGQCTVETSDGDVFVLAHGSSFGESSMLQQQISPRTIRARTKCLLWRLERSVYLGIVVRTTAQRKAKYEKLLSGVSLLRSITPSERALVADALKPYHVRADEVVMRIGEKGDYFYIVVKGTMVVMDSVGRQLAQRVEGEYFGEKALLTDEPRSAAIAAVTDCELARIDKKTFVRLCGAVQDLNFRDYEDDGSEAKGGLEKAQKKEQQKAVAMLPLSTEIRKEDHKLVAFETVGQLGRGAFGVVCLVRYRLSNKCYAVKAINKRMVVQQKHVAKVIRERENLVMCSRDPEAAKWTVPLHAAFQDERNLYLMMDFLPGGELFSLLPVKLAEARLIAAQVVLALIAVHNLGIIHRDLKPENLLITRDGHVKVGDFGLSKRVVDRTFTFCGTPDYMAPEVIQNLGHNKAVDYWALGCLLYEMFVGDAPFYRRGGESKVFERILRPKVSFPSCRRLYISASVVFNARRALADFFRLSCS